MADEFKFDFDDDEPSSIQMNDGGDRDPVSTPKVAVNAFKESFTGKPDAETLKRIGSDMLPSIVGDAASSDVLNNIESFKDTISESLDYARSNTRNLATMVKSKIGDSSYIGSKITSAIDYIYGSGDEAHDNGPSKEQLLMQQITDNINSSVKNTDDSKETYEKHLAYNMSMSTNKRLSLTNMGIGKINEFNSKVMRNYFIKSLELQYRHLYVSQDTLNLHKSIQNDTSTLLAAIVKNTGLPDFIKLRSTEALKQKVRQGIINKATGSITGSDTPMGKAISILNKKTSTVFNNAVDMFQGVTDTVDTMSGMEGGPSKGQLVGMGVSDKVKSVLSKVVGKELRSTKMGSKVDSELNEFTSAPSDYLASKASSSNNKFVSKGLGLFSKLLKEEDVNSNLSISTLDGNDNALYSVRTDSTINDVIPSYLSKILKEVSSIRSGKDAEQMYFDRDSRQLLSLSESGNSNIVHKVTSSNDNEVRSTIGIMKSINNGLDVELSSTESKLVTDNMFKFLSNNGNANLSSLKKDGFYDMFNDKALAYRVANSINKFVSNNDGTLNELNLREFNNNLRSFKTAISSVDGDSVTDIIEDGNVDVLKDKGFVKFNKKSSKYELDKQNVSKAKYEELIRMSNKAYDEVTLTDYSDSSRSEDGDGYLKMFVNKFTTMSFKDASTITEETISNFNNKIKSVYDKSHISNKLKREEKLFRVKLGQFLGIDYRPNKIGGIHMFYVRVADLAKTSTGAKAVNNFFDKHMPPELSKHSKLFKNLIYKSYGNILKSDKLSTVKILLNGKIDNIKQFIEKNENLKVGDIKDNVKESISSNINDISKYISETDKKSLEKDIKDLKLKGKGSLDNIRSKTSDILNGSETYKKALLEKDKLTSKINNIDKIKQVDEYIKSAYSNVNVDKLKSSKKYISSKLSNIKYDSQEDVKDKDKTGIPKLISLTSQLLESFKSSKEDSTIRYKEQTKTILEEKKVQLKEARHKAELLKESKLLDRDGDGKRDGSVFKRNKKVKEVKSTKPVIGKRKTFNLASGAIKLLTGTVKGISSLVGGVAGAVGLGTMGGALGLTVKAISGSSKLIGKGVMLLGKMMFKLPSLITMLGTISSTLLGIATKGGGLLDNVLTGGKGKRSVNKVKKGFGKIPFKKTALLTGAGAALYNIFKDDDKQDKLPNVERIPDEDDDYKEEHNVTNIPESVRDNIVTLGGVGVLSGSTYTAKKMYSKVKGKTNPLTSAKPTLKQMQDKNRILSTLSKSKVPHVVVKEANSARKVIRNGKEVIEAGILKDGKFKVLKVFKRLPGLGLILGAGLAAKRVSEGDFKGAVMEMASGILSTIPFLGVPLSIGMDMLISDKDNNTLTDGQGNPIKADLTEEQIRIVGSNDNHTTQVSSYGEIKPDNFDISFVFDNKNEYVKNENKDINVQPKDITPKPLNVPIHKQSASKPKVNNRSTSISSLNSQTNDSLHDNFTMDEDTTVGKSTLSGELGVIAYIIRYVETRNNYSTTGKIGDGAGISFGAYQYTENSGSLKLFMKNFIKLNPPSIKTAKAYLAGFRGNRYKGNHRKFNSWLKSISRTSKGVKAQDQTFVEHYYNKAVKRIPKGLKSIEAKIHVIDAYHNGGGAWVAKHLRNDDLNHIESVRLRYWKGLKSWRKWGKGWTYRLKSIRRLIGKYVYGGKTIPDSHPKKTKSKKVRKVEKGLQITNGPKKTGNATIGKIGKDILESTSNAIKGGTVKDIKQDTNSVNQTPKSLNVKTPKDKDGKNKSLADKTKSLNGITGNKNKQTVKPTKPKKKLEDIRHAAKRLGLATSVATTLAVADTSHVPIVKTNTHINEQSLKQLPTVTPKVAPTVRVITPDNVGNANIDIQPIKGVLDKQLAVQQSILDVLTKGKTDIVKDITKPEPTKKMDIKIDTSPLVPLSNKQIKLD